MLGRWFWNLYALCYDSLNSFLPYQEMLNKIMDSLELKPSQKILDAGCGTGNLEMAIKKMSIRDLEVKATDFSGAMLSRARQKLKPNPAMAITEVNLNIHLPFPDNYFDRVVSVNVIHLLEDPAKAVNEFARVLKHGGKLVIVTLKENYQMPLILKAHAHAQESDEQWKTENLLSWFKLVIKTFGFSVTAFQFIFVALFNKVVAKEVRGFSKKELEKIFFESGLEISSSGLIYGDQELMYVVRKPDIWIKLVKTEEELRQCLELRKKVFVEEFEVAETGQIVEVETDQYDPHSFHFLVVENGEPIGTLRLIEGVKSGGFRGLYNLPFPFDLDKVLEFSRVATRRDKRGDFRVFIKMLKYTHIFADNAGYQYFCGTIRISLLKFLKRLHWDIVFESEPFLYEGKWKIAAFIFTIRSNLEKVIQTG